MKEPRAPTVGEQEMKELVSEAVQDVLKVSENATPTVMSENLSDRVRRYVAEEIAKQRSKVSSLTGPFMVTGPKASLTTITAADVGQGAQKLSTQLDDANKVVNFYSLISGGIGFLPGGFGFVGVFTVQVLMLKDIATVFGQTLTSHLASNIVSAVLGTGIAAGVGGGIRMLALASLPFPVASVVGILASPGAATQALGRLIVQQYQQNANVQFTEGMVSFLRDQYPGYLKEALKSQAAA